MPSNREKPALITSARFSRTLDAGQRRSRYLWTMAVRVVCFVAACLTPVPVNLVLLAAAAVLPSIAVMLANAVDKRAVPEPATPDDGPPAIGSAEVLPGTVVEE